MLMSSSNFSKHYKSADMECSFSASVSA